MEPKGLVVREIVVEPENVDAVRLFRQMRTQWRVETVVAGKNVVTMRHGLDYASLGPIAAGFGVALDENVMDKLRALEGHSLVIYAKREREALQRS